MILSELKQQIDFLLSHEDQYHNYGDLRVTVPCQGIGGPNVAVRNVGLGIDWYSGQFCIHTEGARLTRIDSKEHIFYKMEFVKKNSNFKAIDSGETLVAKWKKEEKVFENKLAARVWLFEKAKECAKKG